MVNFTLPPGFAFSQSSLQDYSDCPLRFRLRYIERLQWPAVETEPALENERRQKEGQLFHRLVQQQLIGIPSEKLTLQASSPDLHRWWENYCTHPSAPTGFAHYPELTLSAPLGDRFRLLAKYDLVSMQPGKAGIIHDWKTYAKRPRDERMAARWQTRIYQALLVQAGSHLNGGISLDPEQVSMTYWYADFPTDPARFSYSTPKFKRDWEALVNLTAEISKANEFTRTVDEKKCAYCLYRSYCERGISAGMEEDLESEQPEPEVNLEQIQEIAF
jgi:hypothetical protein